MPQLNPVSFTSQGPETSDIERRRRLAEMLRQRGMEPLQAQPNAPISPLSGVAKMLNAYTGARMGKQADTDEQEMKKAYQQALASSLSGGGSMGDMAGRLEASGNSQAMELAAQLRIRDAERQASQSRMMTGEEETAAGLPTEPVWAMGPTGVPQVVWEPPKPTAQEAMSPDRFNQEMQLKATGVPKPEQPKGVDVINLQLPDGSVKAFNSMDEAGIAAALQQGAVKQGQVSAPPKVSPKERQTAFGKVQAAQLLRKQISDARAAFDQIKGTLAAGPSGYLMPLSETGQNFDAAVDALRSTVSALTRVPGVGAMSDYETRLDQAKIPQRGRYESTTEQQLQQLEEMAQFIESGYADMLGNDPSNEAGDGWKIEEVR